MFDVSHIREANRIGREIGSAEFSFFKLCGFEFASMDASASPPDTEHVHTIVSRCTRGKGFIRPYPKSRRVRKTKTLRYRLLPYLRASCFQTLEKVCGINAVLKGLFPVNEDNRHFIVIPLLKQGVAVNIDFLELESLFCLKLAQDSLGVIAQVTTLARVQHHLRLMLCV